MKKVFIISAKRTAIGSFGGILSPVSAVQLGSVVIRSALEKANIKPSQVDEVFMGTVCQANLGQAPARQAAILADLLYSVPCTTINKVCSSGMKSIMFGAQAIMLDHADIVVAGGMESMSNVPYYLPQARWGMKYGGSDIIDGLQRDGLSDAYDQSAMGVSADNTAVKYHISREEQDDFAIKSYQRSAHASKTGLFKEEIVPVEVKQKKGKLAIVDEDEEFKRVVFEKIRTLRPSFSENGTVTAANASTINDGASALILAGENAVIKFGLQPIAEIIGFADAAQEPQWFTTAPALAIPKALNRAGVTKNDIDLFEINEAFAVVPLACNKILQLDEEKVNINGGAVSLGHPLAASGARIVTTLIHGLHQKNKETGCASLCNGGGGASAIIIKKV